MRILVRRLKRTTAPAVRGHLILIPTATGALLRYRARRPRSCKARNLPSRIRNSKPPLRSWKHARHRCFSATLNDACPGLLSRLKRRPQCFAFLTQLSGGCWRVKSLGVCRTFDTSVSLAVKSSDTRSPNPSLMGTSIAIPYFSRFEKRTARNKVIPTRPHPVGNPRRGCGAQFALGIRSAKAPGPADSVLICIGRKKSRALTRPKGEAWKKATGQQELPRAREKQAECAAPGDEINRSAKT